jgi:hypothetical protein
LRFPSQLAIAQRGAAVSPDCVFGSAIFGDHTRGVLNIAANIRRDKIVGEFPVSSQYEAAPIPSESASSLIDRLAIACFGARKAF